MNSSVRFHHARFGADAHERAHRIKHIDEEEGEDDDHHIDGEDVGEIKLAEDRRNRRWHIYQSVYFRDAHRNADERSSENTDEQVARHFLDDEHAGQDDADNAEQGRAFGDLTDGDESSLIGSHDTCILQTDEGDEEADTSTDGTFQGSRNSIHHHRADTGSGEDDEDETFDENSRERHLPGIAHSEADREYEESVQTHTRSQSERFLGIDSHHECTHDGSQYGGSEHSVCIHALSGEMTEDVRVTARI